MILHYLNDLKAKIAIGSSVQPNIIFLHFILINSLIAGLIALAAALTFTHFHKFYGFIY